MTLAPVANEWDSRLNEFVYSLPDNIIAALHFPTHKKTCREVAMHCFEHYTLSINVAAATAIYDLFQTVADDWYKDAATIAVLTYYYAVTETSIMNCYYELVRVRAIQTQHNAIDDQLHYKVPTDFKRWSDRAP